MRLNYVKSLSSGRSPRARALGLPRGPLNKQAALERMYCAMAGIVATAETVIAAPAAAVWAALTDPAQIKEYMF
jgi:hypothetical protein